MIKHHPVGAAADEINRLFFLANLRPGAHPAINQRITVGGVVDPEAETVFRLHSKLVKPCLAGDDGAVKTVLELLGLQGLLHRAVRPPVEGDDGLQLFNRLVRPFGLDAFVRRGVHWLLAGLGQLDSTVGGLQALLGPDGTVEARPHPEASDHVHDAVAELIDRQACKILGGRVGARLGFGRIKGPVNILGDEPGILGRGFFRIILGHRAINLTGERLDVFFTRQRLVILILHALAAVAMAVGAELLIQRLAGMLDGSGRRGLQEQESAQEQELGSGRKHGGNASVKARHTKAARKDYLA